MLNDGGFRAPERSDMLHHKAHEHSSAHLPDGLISTTAAQRLDAMTVSDDAIAKRAYDKFVARGCAHGFDQEDWTTAHRELLAEAVVSHSKSK